MVNLYAQVWVFHPLNHHVLNIEECQGLEFVDHLLKLGNEYSIVNCRQVLQQLEAHQLFQRFFVHLERLVCGYDASEYLHEGGHEFDRLHLTVQNFV